MVGAFQGKEIVLIFQQDEPFPGDLLCRLGGFGGGLIADVGCAHGQADEVGHGAQTNPVGDGAGSQHKGQDGVPADEKAVVFWDALNHCHGDDHCHSQHQRRSQCDQLGPACVDDADDVFHVDVEHRVPPSFLWASRIVSGRIVCTIRAKTLRLTTFFCLNILFRNHTHKHTFSSKKRFLTGFGNVYQTVHFWAAKCTKISLLIWLNRRDKKEGTP